MVKNKTLLLIAGLVWLAAGINVMRIGFEEYAYNLKMINILYSLIIFALFWIAVFKKLVAKHTGRIINFEDDRQFIWKFFDLKSFYIMAFMIILGLGIRIFHLMPDVFIAVFYSGIGAALTIAGIKFGINYIRYNI